jgi:hypothetical protein
VTFDVEWTGAIAIAEIRNSSQQFEGLFLQTGTTIQCSAEENGFQFHSELPDPSRNLISVLGREQNGVFFT